MIAAQQRQHRLAIGHHHQALHLRRFRQPGERGDIGDGLLAGRVKLFRRQIAFGIGARRSRWTR